MSARCCKALLLKEEFAFYLQHLSSLKLMNIACLMLMNVQAGCWLLESSPCFMIFSWEGQQTRNSHTCTTFPLFCFFKVKNLNANSGYQVSYCSLSLRILFSFSNNNRQCGISWERPQILQEVNFNITWTTKIDWICEQFENLWYTLTSAWRWNVYILI